MGMLTALGLAALTATASASTPAAQHAGLVVGKMQELNLEQVRTAPASCPASPLRPPSPALGSWLTR
jgi:hypothetical protein